MFSHNNRTDFLHFSVAALSYDIRGQKECGIYKRRKEKGHRLFGRIFVCVMLIVFT